MTAPPIPQANPLASYSAHREEIDREIRSTLESGRYVLGPQTEAFEREFADHLAAPHCLGVASGTDAIELALRAFGIGRGDEVITAAHTASATITAILSSGATPILVDIDETSLSLDPAKLIPAVSERTRAIVPVHLYGQCVPKDPIVDFARKHSLAIVEDCAQAIGSRRLHMRLEPDIRHALAFSFYPTKNLGAIGDAGAIATASRDTADEIRRLREYGWSERYVSAGSGTNSRLDEIQAAILRVKLRHLGEAQSRRREIARNYARALADTPLQLPVAAEEEEAAIDHAWHLFVVRYGDRARFQQRLAAVGIGTGIHYPHAIHHQPAFSALPRRGPLTVSEAACRTVLSLPLWPELTDEEVERVTKEVHRALLS